MPKYQGGCHCGNVRYEFDAEFSQVLSCNCSICLKKGTLLTFIGEPQFKLVKGQDAQSEYLFNKKVIHHKFCKTCGVTSFSNGTAPDGKKMIAINARTIDGVDLDRYEVTEFNGRDH
jgi:hypothetical protein